MGLCVVDEGIQLLEEVYPSYNIAKLLQWLQVH